MGTALLLNPREEVGSEGDRRRRRGKRVHRETALRRLGTLLLGILSLLALPLGAQCWADHEFFHGVDYRGLSLGARATCFDPLDGYARWFGGAQARWHFSMVFAIEGSVDYRRNEFGPNTRVDTYPVQVSLLAYLLPGMRISPFVLGGGGWYYTHVKGGGVDDTQNRFGLHAGGGLQFFINRHWSLDSTYRYVWLENVASSEVNIINKDFQDSGQMVTIGLNFHF